MIARNVSLIAFAFACALSGGHAVEVSAKGAAIKKVVAMLNDMLAKGKKDKAAEEVAYAEFSQWCVDHQASLETQITAGASEIETLTAEIGKLQSDATTLGEEIAELQADVEKYEADHAAQTAQREKDHAAFLAEQKDYGESVDALERAIAVLMKQNYDRTALIQLSTSQDLPAKARDIVAAFVGMSSDDDQDPSGFMAKTAPQANAYEFQSTSIIDVLKKLRDEFTEKKGEVEKEEMNSKHAFDMVIQDLSAALEKANEEIGAKTALKQEKQEKAAVAQKQLSNTEMVKTEDEKTLADTKSECSDKSESFTEKQQLRAEELQALQKAIEILDSDDVQASGEKYLSLSQGKSKATSLVQTANKGTTVTISEGIRRKVREFLAKEGERLHSRQLGLLAEKMAADPFAKVKKMIDDMITRLLEEAHADADHEGFCDKEVGQSKITRNKLSEEIDGLTAETENGKATIAMLTEDVARLAKEVDELTAAMKQATDMRVAEKAQNAATVKDAQEAQKAVQAALAVLKDFYGKAATATAFVQDSKAPTLGSDEWNALANPDFEGTVDKGHKAGMQTFGETYTGQQDAAGGVLAMLEVIESDFATLQADTESAEELSKTTFDDFMAESKKDKAAKSKQIEMNSADKVAAEGKLRDDIADLKLTQDKLLAAERYYEKLAPQCDDQGMTFEERTQAREAEIKSLKEALQILEGQDIATSA